MKKMKLMMAMAITLFMTSACAGLHSYQHDEKYDLSGQLEEVTEIHKYTMRDWHKVDNQSFVLQTGASNYYLVTLVRPAFDLMFTETIRISNTGSNVRPGYDRVTVYHAGSKDDYVINKIYKLDDYQQVKEIRDQLRG